MIKKIVFFLGLGLLFSAGQTVSTETINDFTSNLIEGTVLDENGSALVGASVTAIGSNRGTVTDSDGKFKLKWDEQCADLRISYIGYTTKEERVCAGTPALVKMAIQEEEEMDTAYEMPATRQMTKAMKMTTGAAITPRGVHAYSSAAPVPYSNYDAAPNFNTEDYAHIQENRFYEVTQNPMSTFSIDVDAASYSNMRRFLNNGQKPPEDAIRIEEMVNYFNYDYPEPAGEHPFEVITEVSDCPWAPEHRLIHIGLQGKKIPTDQLPASNLVFLLDVSGSMEASNKLPLLRSSFKLLTDQLREQDKVSIVVYAGAAGMVLEPTGGDDKQKIKAALDKLSAGGSTAGGAGIQLAYKTARENFIKGGNNRVILATDGDFNVGASSDAALVRMIEEQRQSGVFLTVLGFGMGNYKDNKMQQLANKGNGNHAYIDNISEAKKVLVSEFGGTMFTIAKDVKIQIEFNPAKVAGYRLIGYENRLLDKEDFNDDAKDAGELGSGHTVTALYEVIPAGVKSEYLAKVDDLKYQSTKVERSANASDELMTVKLRYKQPDGDQSQLIEKAVKDGSRSLNNSSDNFRWAAAVAEFGLLLRDSDFKGEATYTQAKKLAEDAKGKDPNGYRKELIDMIDTMKSLAEPETAGKN
jgi:Ca-activated chloride channel family protein